MSAGNLPVGAALRWASNEANREARWALEQRRRGVEIDAVERLLLLAAIFKREAVASEAFVSVAASSVTPTQEEQQ